MVLGLVFIGGGIYMMTEGQSAKDEVRAAVVSENIITSEDASIPNVLVDNAAKAKAEADVIGMHYLEITGGKTYADLDRDDPNRETAFRAVQLRTSLNLAVMGFKVADLVIGLGVFMIVVGATFIVFMAPAVFYSAAIANHYNELIKKEAA
ncbi:MAG: aromatic ring-opening dioxygenase LigA [Chloroflexi bacterium]|nr:aromatic ring-opening dioxygenase LigA [Chloroflexota bacterium]